MAMGLTADLWGWEWVMGLVGDLWGGYGADSRSMGLGMGYGAAEGRSMGQKMCGAAPSLCGKGGTEGRDNWG